VNGRIQLDCLHYAADITVVITSVFLSQVKQVKYQNQF